MEQLLILMFPKLPIFLGKNSNANMPNSVASWWIQLWTGQEKVTFNCYTTVSHCTIMYFKQRGNLVFICDCVHIILLNILLCIMFMFVENNKGWAWHWWVLSMYYFFLGFIVTVWFLYCLVVWSYKINAYPQYTKAIL